MTPLRKTMPDLSEESTFIRLSFFVPGHSPFATLFVMIVGAGEPRRELCLSGCVGALTLKNARRMPTDVRIVR